MSEPMNQAPEIAERLERLTGLIKNSQYRSYDIKVPKDDLRAALKLITTQAAEIAELKAFCSMVAGLSHSQDEDSVRSPDDADDFDTADRVVGEARLLLYGPAPAEEITLFPHEINGMATKSVAMEINLRQALKGPSDDS